MPLKMLRRWIALALVLSAATPALGGPPAEEVWYAVLLQGRPVGWSHTVVRRESGRVISEETLSVTVRRGTEALTVEVASRFAETPEGVPLEAESRQRLGAEEVVRSFRFGGPEVEVTVREADRVRTLRVPAPDGVWLTPAAVDRRVEAEVAAGADQIRYRTVSLEGDLVACEVSMHRVGSEPLEVSGKIVPALVWDSSVSLLPGVTAREYTDDRGRALQTTLELFPGLPLTLVEADRDLALAAVSPPEILASTLVVPEGRLREPRGLRRAIYEVRVSGSADAAPTLPSAGAQHAVPAGPGLWRVTVDLDEPQGDSTPPGDEDRRPSAYVGSDDPEVVRLAGRALGGKTLSEAETAEALRRFVHGFVRTRDLSVGFATAGQVARTAQGDCTEHAVLLAALLRARGIPSRVVSGLLYVDRFLGREAVFGYHLWTQAWLTPVGSPGRWVDLDATLGERPFDAAHVALGTSALAEGAFSNDLLRLSPLLGRLSLRVVEPAASSGTP